MRSIAIVTVAVMAMVGGALAQPPGPVPQREISRLSATLDDDPSEKARLSAAVALGRLRDPRGVPALVRALGDSSPVVRGVAASALGVIGDPKALPALQRATSDPNPNVRQRATRAIERIGEKAKVRGVSSRVVPHESPRRGGKEVRLRVVASNKTAQGPARKLGGVLRASLESRLADAPGVDVVEDEPRFIVDGSITSFERRTRGKQIEITCEVRLTVSEPSGRIVGMVTGQGVVQAPRTRKPEVARELDEQAVTGAVDGAREKLLAYLKTVR